MMETALVYSDMISRDFSELMDLLEISNENNNGLILSEDEKIQEFHQKLFILNDVVNELDFVDENAKNAFLELISSFLDFIWLMSCSRYKVAVITLRSGMEMYAKGLVRNIASTEVDSFSNNIEKVNRIISGNKKIKLNLSVRAGKDLKKFLNREYVDAMKSIYWEYSDTVHGRVGEFSDFTTYMESILEKENNYNESIYNKIMDLSNNEIELLLEYLIIIELDALDDKMNPNKLEFILRILGSNFNFYRNTYLV